MDKNESKKRRAVLYANTINTWLKQPTLLKNYFYFCFSVILIFVLLLSSAKAFCSYQNLCVSLYNFLMSLVDYFFVLLTVVSANVSHLVLSLTSSLTVAYNSILDYYHIVYIHNLAWYHFFIPQISYCLTYNAFCFLFH